LIILCTIAESMTVAPFRGESSSPSIKSTTGVGRTAVGETRKRSPEVIHASARAARRGVAPESLACDAALPVDGLSAHRDHADALWPGECPSRWLPRLRGLLAGAP
jgi:hypothetical protein